MIDIWRYLLVGLCVVGTSSKAVGSLDNGKDLLGNLASDVKAENIQTPPFDTGLNIDSDELEPGHPGNPSGRKSLNCDELCKQGDGGDSCSCPLPPFLKKIFEALLDKNGMSSEYKIVPFDKEDVEKLKGSELCQTMCDSGISRPPCVCK